MRIAQIIDSLDAGGAERIAVNYANALSGVIELSALVTTRKEGVLKENVCKNVHYLFLEKKLSLDFGAVFRLRTFLKRNKIDILHAHGTSFFIGALLKLVCPKIKLIWHEHYGARQKQKLTSNLILYFSSHFFSKIFVVNKDLENWMKQKLRFKKTYFIPNFASTASAEIASTFLKGEEGKRIVFLANLKNPKNHIAALNVFHNLNLKNRNWSLHLIGKDFQDHYSNELKSFIGKHNLSDSIYLYNSRNDIQNILSQSDIGILCSTDEGFPVSLLEYGNAGIAVVSTNAGYCSSVIDDGENGFLFDSGNTGDFELKLNEIVNKSTLRKRFAIHLHKKILQHFSEESVIQELLLKYKH